jgi:hypothetical protein
MHNVQGSRGVGGVVGEVRVGGRPRRCHATSVGQGRHYRPVPVGEGRRDQAILLSPRG